MYIDLNEIITAVVAGLILAFLLFILKKRLLISQYLTKTKIKYFPISFDIAISIDSREGLNSGKYYKELISIFEKIINEEGLSKVIKIKNLGGIKSFVDDNQARVFLEKRDLNLLIWGEFSSDGFNEEGKGEVNKPEIKITYPFVDNHEGSNVEKFSQDLSGKFANRNNWKIYHNNSSDDIKKFSNNVSDLALYVLAISLGVRGEILKSTEIFEKHIIILRKRNHNLVSSLENYLYQNYVELIKKVIYDYSKYNEHENYMNGKSYCEKGILLNSNSTFMLTNLAYFEYKTGNKYKSKELVKQLKEKYPNLPSTIINVAFMKLLDGDYNEAFKWYKKLEGIKIEDLDCNIITVIGFLGIEYKKDKNIGLLFASGYLSFLYGDKSIAEKDLSTFINEIDRRKYRVISNKTEKILQYL